MDQTDIAGRPINVFLSTPDREVSKENKNASVFSLAAIAATWMNYCEASNTFVSESVSEDVEMMFGALNPKKYNKFTTEKLWIEHHEAWTLKGAALFDSYNLLKINNNKPALPDSDEEVDNVGTLNVMLSRPVTVEAWILT